MGETTIIEPRAFLTSHHHVAVITHSMAV